MAYQGAEALSAKRGPPCFGGWSRALVLTTLGLLGMACGEPGEDWGINDVPPEGPVPPCQFPPAPTAYGTASVSCNVLGSNEVSPPRSGCALAYDEGRQVVVLFGGDGTQTRLGDTWEYDGAGWTQVQTGPGPSARYWHAMAYDSNRRVVVLFGGTASGDLGDTWEYDGKTWKQVGTPVSPPAQSTHRLVYDSVRKRTIPGTASDRINWRSRPRRAGYETRLA